MRLFNFLKNNKETENNLVNEQILKFDSRRNNSELVNRYENELKNIIAKFYEYKNNAKTIIKRTAGMINHTVITKGAIINFTPFYMERLGSKLNGKIINSPVKSDYCMKYHYDSNDRIIMVEEYSTFLRCFIITEIYLYHDNYTEKLWFSSGLLARLFVFDNAFANTGLCLSFAGRNGYSVEEFVYEDNFLKEVNKECEGGNYKDVFFYEQNKMIMIEHIWPSGESKIIYTTKKPNFKKIQAAVYDKLKNIIIEQNGNFKALGIEGFLDQQNPAIYVCFTNKEKPDDLIADWNVEMKDIEVYDWQLSEEQERKSVKMIAEILVSLVNEGILDEKQIYFHQNQVCVSQLYLGAKNVFKKAGLNVK